MQSSALPIGLFLEFWLVEGTLSSFTAAIVHSLDYDSSTVNDCSYEGEVTSSMLTFVSCKLITETLIIQIALLFFPSSSNTPLTSNEFIYFHQGLKPQIYKDLVQQTPLQASFTQGV